MRAARTPAPVKLARTPCAIRKHEHRMPLVNISAFQIHIVRCSGALVLCRVNNHHTPKHADTTGAGASRARVRNRHNSSACAACSLDAPESPLYAEASIYPFDNRGRRDARFARN